MLNDVLDAINDWAWLVLIVGLVAVFYIHYQRWQSDHALAVAIRQRESKSITLQATPKVSILVAAWNEGPLIESHIASVKGLRYPHKQLVLCAGGTDETYQLSAQHEDDTVKVLHQAAGEGKQRALRCCLEESDGDIIFLTDADSILNDTIFEHTLSPIVNDHASVATGSWRPLDDQLSDPFVLHRWFIDLYSRSHWGDHTDGLLGANIAIDRAALEKVKGFDADVETGTDYHMAKELHRQGFTIRYVDSSVIETRFAQSLKNYHSQQTRWLRNVVTHGFQFKVYNEVVKAFIPSMIGVAMILGGPILWWLVGPILGVLWLLAWAFVFISRLRYMRFGEIITQIPFRLGYLYLPAYIVIDFIIWALIIVQYPMKRWRTSW